MPDDRVDGPSEEAQSRLGYNDFEGAGMSSIVFRVDAVAKFPLKERHREWIDVEARVYESLPPHRKNFVGYFGRIHNGILLEKCTHGSLWQYWAMNKLTTFDLQLRWAQQVLDALQFLHSKDILHGDMACYNIFIDAKLDAKLADFAGSSIDGSWAPGSYGQGYYHPKLNEEEVSVKTEVFALGSTLYEIMTKHRPYADYQIHEWEKAFTREEYPDVSSLPAFGPIIYKCWKREYKSVAEVKADVDSEAEHHREKGTNTKIRLFDTLQRTAQYIRERHLTHALFLLPAIPIIALQWKILSRR